MTPIVHKRGSTFAHAWDATDNGAPMDLTGWSARSHLRDKSGALVQTFVVSLDVPNSKVHIGAPYTDTEAWPVAMLAGDIELTHGADRRITEDFFVDVEAARTFT